MRLRISRTSNTDAKQPIGYPFLGIPSPQLDQLRYYTLNKFMVILGKNIPHGLNNHMVRKWLTIYVIRGNIKRVIEKVYLFINTCE